MSFKTLVVFTVLILSSMARAERVPVRTCDAAVTKVFDFRLGVNAEKNFLSQFVGIFKRKLSAGQDFSENLYIALEQTTVLGHLRNNFLVSSVEAVDFPTTDLVGVEGNLAHHDVSAAKLKVISKSTVIDTRIGAAEWVDGIDRVLPSTTKMNYVETRTCFSDDEEQSVTLMSHHESRFAGVLLTRKENKKKVKIYLNPDGLSVVVDGIWAATYVRISPI